MKLQHYFSPIFQFSKIGLILVFLVCTHTIAFTQFGQVDPDFLVKRPANGRYTADGDISFIQATSNNKLLAGGKFTTIDNFNSPAIARINANGNIDTTFRSPVSGSCTQVHTYSNGKILAAGRLIITATEEYVGIVRMLPDGSLDPSFNIIPDFHIALGLNFGVADNGIILVGGQFLVGQPTLRGIAVLDSNGNIIDSPISQRVKAVATNITYLGGNQFLLGGSNISYNNNYEGSILKISLNGELDSSYESPQFKGKINKIYPDGQNIWVIGEDLTIDNTYYNPILKLKNDGQIDTSFHLDVQSDFYLTSEITQIYQINSNEFHIIGDFDTANNIPCANKCRFDSSGNVLSDANKNLGYPNYLVSQDSIIFTCDVFGAINKFDSYVRDSSFFYPIIPQTQYINDIELQSDDDIIVANSGGLINVFMIKPNGFREMSKFPQRLVNPYEDTNIQVFPNDEFEVCSYTNKYDFVRYNSEGEPICKAAIYDEVYAQTVFQNDAYVLTYDGNTNDVMKVDTDCEISEYHTLANLSNTAYAIAYFDPYFYVAHAYEDSSIIKRYDNDFKNPIDFIHLKYTGDLLPKFYQIDGKFYITNLIFIPSNKGALFRFLEDGAIDSTFKKIPNAYALAQHNDYLLVGGAFTEIQGKPYKGFARLHMDGTVDTTYVQHGGCNGTVRDIKVLSNGDIIVAGEFTEFDGYACNNIVKLSGQPNATYEPIGYTDEYTLYPNPATNQLTIQGNNQQSFSVSIYDSLGRLWMQSGKSNGQTLTIAIDQLPPMVYFVQSKADGTMIGKFVKQ